MAIGALGSLVVSLGLDAVEYVTGMTKAEYQTQKSMRAIQGHIEGAARSIKTLAGAVGIGFGVHEILSFAKEVTLAAEAIGDLSAETGSSVENLSRMQNQFKLSGASAEDFEQAIQKLAAGLAGNADGSDKVTRAMKFLGVSTKDPAQAMQEIADKLNQFQDGAGKAAFAMDVFGRGGVRFLAALKTIAEGHELAGTRTAEQAQNAAELAQAIRSLQIESTKLADIFLGSVAPAITEIIRQFVAAREQAGSLLGAFQLLTSFSLFGTPADDAKRLSKEIADLDKQIAQFEKSGTYHTFLGDFVTDNVDSLRAARETATKQLAFVNKQLEKEMMGPPDSLRGKLKPAFGFTSAGGDKGAGKERQSDAERYLQNLQKQQEQLEHLSVAEQFRRDVQMDRIKGITNAEYERLHNLALQIDAIKKMQKAEEDAKRAAEERAQAEEHLTAQLLQESDRLRESNQQLQDEVALIGASEQQVIAFTKAKNDEAIARAKVRLEQLSAAGITGNQVEELQTQIELLQKRNDLLTSKAVKQQLLEDARVAAQINEIFANSFADTFSSIVNGTKSVSDAFRDMARNIAGEIGKLAAQNIAKQIFGTATGGGGIGGFLAQLLGMTGSSSAAASGSGIGYGATTGDIFPVGLPYAGGTNYATAGMHLVGEHGPEGVILPRGAQVIPNDVLMARRSQKAVTQNNYITVPGSTSRASADQLAAELTRRSLRAQRRNG